eukprot:4942442-Alexandrium_andersonii.AAC.1
MRAACCFQGPPRPAPELWQTSLVHLTTPGSDAPLARVRQQLRSTAVVGSSLRFAPAHVHSHMCERAAPSIKYF